MVIRLGAATMRSVDRRYRTIGIVRDVSVRAASGLEAYGQEAARRGLANFADHDKKSFAAVNGSGYNVAE
jgi:hypothetical protein